MLGGEEMKRVAYAGVSLNPKRFEEDRKWVLELLKRMKVRRFKEEGLSITFKIDVDTPAFSLWVEAMNERTDLTPHHIWVGHLYTIDELLSSPLLEWYPGSIYLGWEWKLGGPYIRCQSCGSRLEQTGYLEVEERKLKGRGIVCTDRFEILISRSFKEKLVEAGFTGFKLLPVFRPKRGGEGEPAVYQLVVENILPPMASPPTEFEEREKCEVCGTEAKVLRHLHWLGRVPYHEFSEIYYPWSVLEVMADFNLSFEKIGKLPFASPLILITPRVYWWLCEQGEKGALVKPVYLV